MSNTSLKFGTSGLRGLAVELASGPAYDYTAAFLGTVAGRGEIRRGGTVCIGRDLRDSSPEIAALCMEAITDSGFSPADCGALPTPALSLYAMNLGAPAIMVTGSHIPADRNGLKFYRAMGEIDKVDEQAIVACCQQMSGNRPQGAGRAREIGPQTLESYRARYAQFLEPRALSGLKVGVYQHSSVARDLIIDILSDLGAETRPLGRSDHFVPVDTEALAPEDRERLAGWVRDGGFDAIVSTDGDADRPLIADELGRFVRGDLVGAITAYWLGADCIVVPVTANSALEACSRFGKVIRTRVGSPYVIAGMNEAVQGGAACVVGFEANGGVLLGTPVVRCGRALAALPTRDAMLPVLACLSVVTERGKPLSIAASEFGFRTALSDRLQDVRPKVSAAFLASLGEGEGLGTLVQHCGPVTYCDRTDGVRLIMGSGSVVHYRPSGNAPELRCYVEAPDYDEASRLLAGGIALAREFASGEQ
ncbi:phosphomannomutase [Oricola cellulosilytica]|uniref:Phosphomannomutase n=1 Tax=Oricola cellulosilytica TaxID=1429082 RepID=A0A4R0P601_9HYPH|nr:phosphomannomutase [Oricola cellulosilytica]TCD11321.1 phosphomannomutase [Oricola cellulosilytica]